MARVLTALLAAAALLPAAARADHSYGYDRGSGYDQGYGPVVVTCASVDQRDRYCPVDTRGGVRLVRRESRADCVLGRTWGYDRGGIWVAHGCRARFEVGGDYAYGPGPGYGRPGYGRGPQRVRCESIDNRPRFCPVRGRIDDVRIDRRLSRSRCEFGYSWGFQRDGIWVKRGCRADFVVY